MIFDIDFNRENDDETLELLGANLCWSEDNDNCFYTIEVEDFFALEELLKKVDDVKKDYYSAVVTFDPPTIYFDSKI